MTVDRSQYLHLLEQKIQQDEIIQLVKADSRYLDLFSENKIQIYAGQARYILTQPKAGIKFRPDLSVHSGNDFSRQIDIAWIDIPSVIDKVYYDLVVEDRFQEALDTPAKVAELTTQLKENIAEQITDDINEKVEEIWTTDGNYKKNTTNLENGEAPDGNLYEMSDKWFSEADKVLGAIYNTSSAFLNKNDLFQLGWMKPADQPTDPATRTKVKTNTKKLKDIFLVLDSTVHNLLAIGKFSQAFNFKFVDLKERFGEVIETSLPNKYKIVMFDKRVMVLKPRDRNKGLEHKYEPETQTNWFFCPSKVYAGLITCLNYCAWKVA
ncbi:protein of unknown function [endosymbiont DhMRE of Dentiscutata heterogama]|uniref:hypothetical protein n=1 Tax=endosymbiont DhMRE of Dentiscutata heterogama TaxID=1609546 RepID=UPI000629D59D|nr:hypothetical protein [endosymbiont DhMRE of Dentiscutata heterogama]CFW93312.1 protein of unknown function [endosymbiont DhMRE of Dentiscutata heterogama]